MDTTVLILAVLGAITVGAVGLIFSGGGNREKANKRVSAVNASSGVRRVSGGGTNQQSEVNQKERRKKLAETLESLDNNTKDLKKKKRVTIDQMLAQAGLEATPQAFYIASFVVGIVFVVIGLISGQQLWISGLLFFVGALGFPRWVVGFLKKRRQKKFGTEFSNAIDVIVRGVKSGLPVNECLKIIAREAPAPVCDEFHLLTESLRVGLSLEQALDRMFERMPLQEVNFFGIVLLIQQKTGGNLAEALGNLANVLRSRKLMTGKIKALSAEAKASAYIIGALPFMVMGAVKLASPDYLEPLFSTPTGNFVLIASGIWMSMGVLVMKNMIQIKV